MRPIDRLTLRHELLPSSARRAELVPVARLGRPWGVHGDITVRLYNPDSDVGWAADVMLLRGDGFPLAAVAIDRWKTKGDLILLRPAGIDSPELVGALVGFEVLAHPDEFSAPEDDDEVYVHELLGMEVVDVVRGRLGVVADVFATGSNDVWVVRGDDASEMLLPAVKSFVLGLDRVARVVRVRYDEE